MCVLAFCFTTICIKLNANWWSWWPDGLSLKLKYDQTYRNLVVVLNLECRKTRIDGRSQINHCQWEWCQSISHGPSFVRLRILKFNQKSDKKIKGCFSRRSKATVWKFPIKVLKMLTTFHTTVKKFGHNVVLYHFSKKNI